MFITKNDGVGVYQKAWHSMFYAGIMHIRF
jgi:hypothetical protein